MSHSAKVFLKVNEDILQILLMLEVIFIQDSEVKDLFCCASQAYFSAIIISSHEV